MTNENHKLFLEAIERAYRDELFDFSRDYFREHRPGYIGLSSDQHYLDRMSRIESTHLALLKLMNGDKK